MPSFHPGIKAVRESVCVLYEPETGQVRHMHCTLVLEGGYNPTAAEEEAMAHAALQRRAQPHANLVALHVAQDTLKPYSRYRVDVRTKQLVALQVHVTGVS
jgi:hypothetical protein